VFAGKSQLLEDFSCFWCRPFSGFNFPVKKLQNHRTFFGFVAEIRSWMTFPVFGASHFL